MVAVWQGSEICKEDGYDVKQNGVDTKATYKIH